MEFPSAQRELFQTLRWQQPHHCCHLVPWSHLDPTNQVTAFPGHYIFQRVDHQGWHSVGRSGVTNTFWQCSERFAQDRWLAEEGKCGMASVRSPGAR